MGPLNPDLKKDQSSDSDDEHNVRHDRFRSERFQEERRRPITKNREREDPYNNVDRHSSGRHRGRSPSRSYNPRDSMSSSTSHRNEARRSNHDRKDRDKGHHSKSSKLNKDERKNIEADKYEKVNINESGKKTLSSILKNFDKHLESKRKNLEVLPEVGPALPPQLKENCKEDNELVTINLITDESLIGPALPPNVGTTSDSSDDELCITDSTHVEDIRIDQTPVERHKTLPTSSEGDTAHTCVSSEGDTVHQTDQTEGPALPLHLKHDLITGDFKNNSISSSTEVDNSKQNNDSVASSSDSSGPALPPETAPGVYGPMLPPAVEKESYGPALPPNFKKENVKGPTLPAGITADQLEALAHEESEDEDMVGPLPEGKMNMTQFQLDLRASHIKRKLEEEKSGTSKDIKKREEWMLELPPEKASNLGLGPRSFRMREAPDMSDRSGWTDTPSDKLRKIEQALTGEPEPVDTEEMKRSAFIKERDEAMDKLSQLTQDQDRPHSLLEIHQKKIKKKKKKEEKEGKKKERRPFDRNIDLQVNRFDDAQKKAIFKKAQLLDTRFSTGESKFL